MRVRVYSTPTCPYCKMAKSFLDQQNVPYEDLDVSADGNALDEMMKRSGQMGVPVIDIDGETVIGFDQGRIADLVAKRRDQTA
jgi:glutaredoxin-like YruB-family protein